MIAKGSDLQDPELVHGLQSKTVAVECLRLSQTRIVPDGWNQDALKHFASRWQTIHTLDGKDLWLKMDTGQTQYTSPFVAEIKPDSSDLLEELTAYWGEAMDPANAVLRPEVVVFQRPVDQPVQVRDSLTNTVPKARIIPNRIVMSTSGAQYDRWKHATQKGLQAFLKTAWKEPTPELRARYFASKKKKVVMQLLVFSLKPMTAETKAQGLAGDEYEKGRICLQGHNHEGFQVQNSTTNADAHLLRLFLAA